MVLLDTHVWFWWVEGDKRIGRTSRNAIADAERRDGIRISAASVFEIASLHTHGRLRLRWSPERWITEALDVTRARIGELTAAIALDAGLIPRTTLPDPVDRLLVATARGFDLTIVTADLRILDYATANHVRARHAGR